LQGVNVVPFSHLAFPLFGEIVEKGERTETAILAAAVLAEYERAWAELRKGSKVRAALAFEDWEHFWISCHSPSGAVQIARRRLGST